MRFLHTSDLHIGKRLGAISLEEDMRYMLDQLIAIAKDKQVDAIVVAGDVFDTAIPSEASVRMWDEFLKEVASLKIPLLTAGGNHDSGARLAVGSALMQLSGVYISGELKDVIECVVIDDVAFWMVPFVRPSEVRSWAKKHAIDDSSVINYDSAFRLLLQQVVQDPRFANHKNVCIAHQFVTNHGESPERSDSELMTIGTLDNVEVDAFDKFDYVALGHIHRPQKVGRATVRYAGSPLKLSASEISYHKSFCLVDVDPNRDEADVELIEFVPLRDFVEQKGSLQELIQTGEAQSERERQNYVAVTITDELQLDVVAQLRRIWPNLVTTKFENSMTQAEGTDAITDEAEIAKSSFELFSDFFKAQMGRPMSESEQQLVNDVLEQLGKEGSDETN